MQKMMTKMLAKWFTTLAISLYACSISAAQYPDDCPCDLSTYQYDGGVKINAELLFMTAHMRNTEYAARLTGLTGTEGSIKPLKADFDFEPGFQLEIGYQFPGTAYEVSLRFFSLVFGASQHSTGADLQGKFVNVFDQDLPAGLQITNPVHSATGKIGLDIRNIDLTFGQTVQTASDRLHLKWLIGARTSTIHQKFKAIYMQTAAADLVETVSANSELTGWGPFLGAHAGVQLGHGFSVQTELASGFLLSKINSHLHDTITHTTLLDAQNKPLSRVIQQAEEYNDKIISMLDSRIGLLYTRDLRNDSQLGIEAGLQVSQYFDSDFRFASSGSDISIMGIYLRASYLM